MLVYMKSVIGKYECISFDMFDTLILRKTMVPSDVFLIVEKIYNQQYLEPITNFVDIRVQAEKDLYRRNHQPVTIDEIYSNIPALLECTKNRLKRIEIETELRCVYVNKQIYKIYQYCLKRNKKIIVVSDMYLNCEILEIILKNAGYNEFDKVFVSSDLKCDKLSGDIYRIVNEEMKNDVKDKILHLGDNFYKDYKIPKRNDCSSIWYFNIRKNYLMIKRLLIGKFLSKDIICNHYYDSIINSYQYNTVNQYYSFGYKYIGGLIYDYVRWIGNELKDSGIESVFFMAREGLFIKKAFDLCWGNEFKSKYICVSRKSLKCALEKNPSNQKELLVRYLKQNNMNGKFGLVDIGWIGSMQMSIYYALTSNHIPFCMTGFFLGQKTEFKQYKNILFNKAFLFNYDDNSQIKDRILRALNLLEILFSANHGTTIGYEELSNGKVAPKFAEYEQDEQSTIIKKVQSGALDFIKKAVNVRCCQSGHDIAKNTEPISSFLLKPEKKDIEWMGNLYMFVKNEKRYLAKKQPLVNIILFMKEYKLSLWRDAYILRNLPLLFPVFTWLHSKRVTKQFKKEISKIS